MEQHRIDKHAGSAESKRCMWAKYENTSGLRHKGRENRAYVFLYGEWHIDNCITQTKKNIIRVKRKL